MTVLILRLRLPSDGEGAERVVIRRRPAAGLLGGLYEFPHIPDHPGAGGVAEYLRSLGLLPGEVSPLGPARHLFTHVEWQMEGYAVCLPPDSVLPTGWLAVAWGETETVYAIPSAFSAYRAAAPGHGIPSGRAAAAVAKAKKKRKSEKADKAEKNSE
jgi:adenine-specific DNA glycosylase